jgi:spore maturation protein CgeB
MKLDIVIFGLAISSSWGNGHAVTYRALTKALSERGHNVTFFERDMPWYRDHRDLAISPYCRLELYEDLKSLPNCAGKAVSAADLVVIGSYVPDGAILAEWVTARAQGVTAFYDIDTPVTLAGLQNGKTDYITADLIPRFDLYLSFTGGPVLKFIEEHYGSPRARALYCTADPDVHVPSEQPPDLALGYLGTYSASRQPALERLLFAPARHLAAEKFAVAGPQYPPGTRWPTNVTHLPHLSPAEHPAFYGRQRFTLNLTRAEMQSCGYSPSVRLFEAAACGVPIISDRWPGIETFFSPGHELLLAETAQDIIAILADCPAEKRRAIAAAARKRFLRSHTPSDRAAQLESYYQEALTGGRSQVRDEVVA